MGILKSIKSSRRKDNIARIAAEQVKAEKLLEIALPKAEADIYARAKEEVRNSMLIEQIWYHHDKMGYGKKRLHDYLFGFAFMVDDMIHERPLPTTQEIKELLIEESNFDIGKEFDELNMALDERNAWRKVPRGKHDAGDTI